MVRKARRNLFLLRNHGSDIISELRPIDAWHVARNLESMYWGYTAGTAGAGLARLLITGNPATLNTARSLASFGARAHFNAVRGVLGTTIARGGTVTLGGAIATTTAAVGLGYAAGAVVGTGISQLAFGEEGARHALDLYSSPKKFWDEGIMGMGENIGTILGHYF
ncbi:MAG: hypothetical protein [Circular genetic element sp.]|nr:MAG: hypothetical protein [Circular genetic element sp.]